MQSSLLIYKASFQIHAQTFASAVNMIMSLRQTLHEEAIATCWSSDSATA